MKLVLFALLVVVSAALAGLVVLAPGSSFEAAPRAPTPNRPVARTPPGPPGSSPGAPPRATRPVAPPGLEPGPELAALRPVDAHARRQANRAELVASGRTTAAWTRGAQEVFAGALASAATGPIDVQFGPLECFAAGCMATATYGDFQAFNAVNQALPESERFRRWPGSKMRTPPEQLPGGHVVADWVLLPPAADDQLAMRQGENQ